jgi:hypothetical protein
MTEPIHKISKGWIVESTDGKTFKAIRKATSEEQKEYDAFLKKPEEKKEEKPKQEKPKEGKPSTTKEQGEPSLLIEPYAYNTDKLHHSKYDKAQWRKWAQETEFKPKSRTVAGQNREFQEHLLTHPDFKDKVRAIHKELGMPYAGKPEDAFLGERWDKIMEKLTAEPEKQPEVKKDLPDLTVKKDEEKPAEEQDVNRYSPQGVTGNRRAPWWLQDIIKTSGAAGDLARVKRYLPWQATPQTFLPEATFYDPTRELAANTEQANLAMQAQQAFTNPQQLAAASSVAQGQALRNAADIMGRYNNLNVGLANQLNQQRTDIMNQASQNKANLDTQLYDKYTIANQQFDNAKALARQKLRQSYMDAITNRAKTQALNSLYPNFQTDPSTGGYVYADPNYTPTATYKGESDDEFDKAVEKYGSVENATKYMDWKYGRTSKKSKADYPYEGYQGQDS